jgi:hypothetical protein
MYLERPTRGRLDTDFPPFPVIKKIVGITTTY